MTISIRHPRRDGLRSAPTVQTSKAASITPELMFMILQHVRHPNDSLPDPPHVLPTLRAIPLVCKAWYYPGIEILYQRVVFLSRSSRQSKQLTSTLFRNADLRQHVNVLCFPDLRFRQCDYYRNERSAIRLRNYARLVSLCPNLVFLRLPTNLVDAFSPFMVPALPLFSTQIENLLSLQLTASVSYPSLFFLPIHTSLPSLVHLMLTNFSFTLEDTPPLSRLLFPSLPRLHSLTLSCCLLESRAATQIFSALQPTLSYLEIWRSGYLPDLTEAAFRILGPTLRTLLIDQSIFEYHARQNSPDMSLAFALPHLTTLRITAESLPSNVLLRLPRSLRYLKITVFPVCGCPTCTSWPAEVNSGNRNELGADLILALDNEEYELKELVLSGRCCAWHNWEQKIQERCGRRGIRLVHDTTPGECQDARHPVRKRVGELVRHTYKPVRRVSTLWNKLVDSIEY